MNWTQASLIRITISTSFAGSLYFHDCPAEWRIPLYLIVGGSVGIIKNFSSLCQKVKNDKDNAEDENVKTTKFDSLLNCFLLSWFIFGKVKLIFNPIHVQYLNIKHLRNCAYIKINSYGWHFLVKGKWTCSNRTGILKI